LFVQCYELMKIPSFKHIHLVAGESGLDRQVTWVYVLQTPSLEDWVYGGEFMFVVNHENVYQIVEESLSRQLSGVVILKNKQNESNLNDEIINFANEQQLPLFEMDYHIKILDITRDISTYIIHKQEKENYLNHFFYKLLLAEDFCKKDIDEFALHLGYHHDQTCLISTIYSEDVSKLSQISISLQLYINASNGHFVSTIISPYIVILAFDAPDSIKRNKKLLKSIFSMLNEKYPDMLYMGIGNTCSSLYKVRYSYIKSIKSIPLCQKEKRIIDYDELGFSRLLLGTLETEELQEYATCFLGKVKEHDKKNQTSFLDTIEAYILCNGNINKTSAKLYIHRNTCIYRLAKIKELFQIDLDDPYIQADILNSLHIFRFLNK
jgi:hypothetical protein